MREHFVVIKKNEIELQDKFKRGKNIQELCLLCYNLF